MKYWRFGAYAISLLIFVLPLTPIRFKKPEMLHDIFGGTSGGLILFANLSFVLICMTGISVWFGYSSIRDRFVNRRALLELFFFPSALLIWMVASLLHPPTPTAEVIYSLNEGREVENFVNPYLGYEMMDCREVTSEFDVIFIPAHLAIETDFLAYAPHRADKSLGGYRWGRKFGEDWYWESSGSQWSTDFRNCYFQNKSPN
jgi:hypothetical protein